MKNTILVAYFEVVDEFHRTAPVMETVIIVGLKSDV